ncbi:MAG: hypothetical protein ACOC0Q_07250 [Wenzhouxiangella sp.]
MEGLFKIDTQMTFTRKVTFNVPGAEGGFTQHSLQTTFKHSPKDEVDEMQQELSDTEAYGRAVIGVKGVAGADGAELPPAEGAAAMANLSSFVFEAMYTYYDAVLGGNLKKKTSARRRSTG